MKPYRIAVFGAGHLGRIHTRLLRAREDVTIVGVVDPVPAARDSVANEFQVPAADHLDALDGMHDQSFAKPLDAAIVATPTAYHHEVALELLERGVHVFVEKPITTTTAQADELIAAVERRDLVLQVGHVERFNPAWQAAARLAPAPRYVEAVRTSGYAFRSTDIGVVLDLMIHDLDIVLSLVGEQVIDVSAVGCTVVGPHEDFAQARLTFANGCVANLTASRTSCQTQRTVQVFGEGAIAQVDFGAGTARLMRPGTELAAGRFDVNRLTLAEKTSLKDRFFQEVVPVEEVTVEKRNAIADEQTDFLDAIRTQRPPLVSGSDGRRALGIAERVLSQLRDSERHFALAPRYATHPAHRMPGPHFLRRAG